MLYYRISTESDFVTTQQTERNPFTKMIHQNMSNQEIYTNFIPKSDISYVRKSTNNIFYNGQFTSWVLHIYYIHLT